jgi:hypothetical protein
MSQADPSYDYHSHFAQHKLTEYYSLDLTMLDTRQYSRSITDPC